MATQFEKDFDDILNDILTDYANLDDEPDTSVGSNPWLMASVLASMLWGLYRYQDWISKQHFPDTADTDNLNHWGSVYNITRDTNDTDTTYLNKILDRLRQPPAGGNALDYENWAKDQNECSYVSGDSTYYNNLVTVVDTPGDILGSVAVYTIPTGDSIDPTINVGLRVDTQSYIDSVRPIGMLGAWVYDSTPQIQTIDVTITQDATVNTHTIKEAIVTDMSSLTPGETLYNSSIITTCINYGAESAIVNTPAADSTSPPATIYFRAGTENITIHV